MPASHTWTLWNEMAEKEVIQVQSSDLQGGETVELSTSLTSRILRRIELHPTPGTFARNARWSNKDLDPVPPEKQTYTAISFLAYWISDSVTASSWRLGSSLISVGLSWRWAIFSIFLGHMICAVVVACNSVFGARFKVPFTIQSRASFGVYFSFVVVFMRCVAAVFYYGIQLYTGAEAVQTMMFAIWPSFRNITNTVPAKTNMTTQMFVAYFLYFLMCIPLHCVPMHKLHYFFMFKSVVSTMACVGVTIYLAHATGGASKVGLFQRGSEVSGSKLNWLIMNGINANIAQYVTLCVNIGDFSRYARKESSVKWQALFIPACFTLTAFFGIFGAGASEQLYGEIIWDPMTIADRWTSPAGRAGAFFVGFGFTIAQLGVNASANSIAAANDINAMLPRFINIRRGQLIVCVFGAWILQPYEIMKNGTAFLNFMNGWAIYLSPVAAIIAADFFVVSKQRVRLPDLYNPDGIYRYGNKYGTNWRGAVAFVVGFAPLLPGFARNVNKNLTISEGAQHFYNIGFFYGFTAAFVVYTGLSYVKPPALSLEPDEKVNRTVTEALA